MSILTNYCTGYVLTFVLMGFLQKGASASFIVQGDAYFREDGSITLTSDLPHSKGCVFRKKMYPFITPTHGPLGFKFTFAVSKEDYTHPPLKGKRLRAVFTGLIKSKGQPSPATLLVDFSSDRVSMTIGNGIARHSSPMINMDPKWAVEASIGYDAEKKTFMVWLGKSYSSQPVLESEPLQVSKMFRGRINIGLCGENLEVGAPLSVKKWRLRYLKPASPPSPPPPSPPAPASKPSPALNESSVPPTRPPTLASKHGLGLLMILMFVAIGMMSLCVLVISLYFGWKRWDVLWLFLKKIFRLVKSFVKSLFEMKVPTSPPPLPVDGVAPPFVPITQSGNVLMFRVN